MKRYYLYIIILAITVWSCTKTKTTVNNYVSPANTQQPAFAINGITDVKLTNIFHTQASMNLSVVYQDSAQESLTLTVSGLPDGVDIDTSWIHSGTPAFGTTLTILDTTAKGAVPGNYPVTLTATTASGKVKNYTFNMSIAAMPTTFLGRYDSSYYFCDSTALYRDSIYADPSVLNKIWFVNYANSGHLIYGFVTLGAGINIPAQTIGGVTYTGGGSIDGPHKIIISINGSCALNMYDGE